MIRRTENKNMTENRINNIIHKIPTLNKYSCRMLENDLQCFCVTVPSFFVCFCSVSFTQQKNWTLYILSFLTEFIASKQTIDDYKRWWLNPVSRIEIQIRIGFVGTLDPAQDAQMAIKRVFFGKTTQTHIFWTILCPLGFGIMYWE